jgi:hypothetical protein
LSTGAGSYGSRGPIRPDAEPVWRPGVSGPVELEVLQDRFEQGSIVVEPASLKSSAASTVLMKQSTAARAMRWVVGESAATCSRSRPKSSTSRRARAESMNSLWWPASSMSPRCARALEQVSRAPLHRSHRRDHAHRAARDQSQTRDTRPRHRRAAGPPTRSARPYGGFASRQVSATDLAWVMLAAQAITDDGGLLDEARVNRLRYLDGTPKGSTRWIDTEFAKWRRPIERGRFAAVANAAGGPETRRRVRADAEVRIFRPGDEQAEADADALYWDRIPVDARAEFVWQLSVEIYGLAHPGAAYEPGLSRSIARVVGR